MLGKFDYFTVESYYFDNKGMSVLLLSYITNLKFIFKITFIEETLKLMVVFSR